MRIRILFAKNENMRFTSHLDLQRTWERTFRRADLPISYSLGYNPRPKINLASALPLGFTSENEVLDAILEYSLPIPEICLKLNLALPPGLQFSQVEEVDIHAASLQSQLIAAVYLITFLDPFPDISKRLDEFLAKDSLIRERRGKTYDLRPLIETLIRFEEDDLGHQRVLTRLTAKEGATGRPEEVIDAMGYDPLAARIHRKRLIFKET